jgi:hypothetical protein
MRFELRTHIIQCHTCQKTKTRSGKPYGSGKIVDVSTEPFEICHMDVFCIWTTGDPKKAMFTS